MEDGDINLSPLPKRANDNNNNQSDRITIDNEHAPSPLNQTINIIPPPPQNMVIDIPTTNDIIIDKNIQQSPLNQTSNNIPPPPTSPLSPPTTLLMETPITIPTNNNENSNIELDPIGEMKAVEISIAEEQRQSISKDKRKSFKRIMNVFGLVSREKLETMDDGTILKKSLPLSRSTALEKDLFTKKMGKKQILATAIPLPSEKEIKHWENKLTDQINRLTTLLAECRQERWNAPLISSYEKLLSLLEMNQKQLISIKLSVNHGFSVMARQEVIFPVLPFLDSIIEEVFLQIGLIIHILVHRIKKENNANQADQLYTTILQQSFEETEALVEECRNTYKKIVKEYQRTNLPALRATEITKVHFFIFAVALTSAVAPFYYYEGRSYHELVIHGIWVCATVILVMSPTLGATITRGFHRIVGTIIGAILGFFISWLVHVVPQPAKQFILIITTFVFVFIASFVQQDVRFSYAGAVAALTFMIISFGSYLAPTFTYTMAVERAFNISLGIVWVLIISVVLFPYFTYKNSRLKFFDATSTMANTFIKIVELGLPTNSDQLANRAKIKGEITGSLRQIRVIMATQKSLLFDIRSELALQPKKSSSHYFKLIGDLSKLYTRLVAFDNAFDYQFSEAMVEAMAPIQQSIHDLNETLILSIDDLRALMHDQERTLERGTSRSLTDCLTELDNSFQAVRRDLLQKKTLFNLHPEMIQFGSGMYSLRDFIKHFIVVLKDFEMIKRDQFQQQHGSIKKPFINRLCDC
ncbi:hypothetical protein PPL_10122 [Heterostelium album PN500]|uniref:Uncharacterized protein n=1 Tax=Heterostelium pallidum (strain ATCC 26659 / Pp 5 / PN500) TaxID=670386 RepID=D3BQD7_HETP5|nr:hypothetical protein PPL_10122 [Heterostelium album PN500]EFA76357.1 hypothetical protein PPL_10122 [Heterostelium album PN500]|eukprot:XP_020428489.1 hypothetical protein PPL_10122 [Heterostelium album PN500]